MTDNLIPWLHQQLDAAEKAAHEAGGAAWATGHTTGLTWGPHGEQDPGTVIYDSDGAWPQQFTAEDSHVYAVGGGMVIIGSPVTTAAQHRHIAFHNPQRVLRKVAATRRLIHDFLAADEHGQQDGGHVFGYHATGMLKAIKHAATEYDDQPGYQERWQP